MAIEYVALPVLRRFNILSLRTDLVPSWVSLVHARFQSAVRGSLYKILSHVKYSGQAESVLTALFWLLMLNYLGEWNK